VVVVLNHLYFLVLVHWRYRLICSGGFGKSCLALSAKQVCGVPAILIPPFVKTCLRQHHNLVWTVDFLPARAAVRHRQTGEQTLQVYRAVSVAGMPVRTSSPARHAQLGRPFPAPGACSRSPGPLRAGGRSTRPHRASYAPGEVGARERMSPANPAPIWRAWHVGERGSDVDDHGAIGEAGVNALPMRSQAMRLLFDAKPEVERRGTPKAFPSTIASSHRRPRAVACPLAESPVSVSTARRLEKPAAVPRFPPVARPVDRLEGNNAAFTFAVKSTRRR
jgi:hypothetical protein